MKKLLICLIALSSLAGCASISEYNKGCRDGVKTYGSSGLNEKTINEGCDALDAKQRAEQRSERQGGGHRP
jgi:uncharacterized protein YceK